MFFLQTGEPTSEPLLSFGFKKIQKVQKIYRVKTKQVSTKGAWETWETEKLTKEKTHPGVKGSGQTVTKEGKEITQEVKPQWNLEK